MAINPILTNNIDNTKSHKPYREANGTIRTDSDVKPLPAQGHLVHDSITTIPKYFIKDVAYDLKAIKDGFQGNANDHQLGRLNDVGLKLGGIGIATMLAARTKNPMLRIMEFTGLGAFLASMSLFPTVAINAPSRIVQGFDIGKEYIDDQGRKKAVLQDPNYIPFDMYQGEYPGEDLDVIGDRMGIPRGIKNRNDLIKEQMRKIAIQNNTLWMMTVGVATPVIAALMCCGLEKVISPALENSRNALYNSRISNMLTKTENMSSDISKVASNNLSNDVQKILENYKGKELPEAEFKNLVESFTKELDANTSEGIKADLSKILRGNNSYVLNSDFSENIVRTLKQNVPARNQAILEKTFVLTSEEVNSIISKYGKSISDEQISNIKQDFKQLFDSKIANQNGMSKEALNAYRNEYLELISKNLQSKVSSKVDEAKIKNVVDFAKVIGEFKNNQKILDKCKSFKVEHAPETVLAKSYGKFENTLIDVLGIKFKELKQMRQSEDYAKEVLDKKLQELAKDDARYTKAVEKLTKVMSEMDVHLDGKSETASHLKDLITGIENNYNNTAKRLSNIGNCNNTIDKLVKEDVSTLSNSLKDKQDLFDLLDGVKINKYAGANYWSMNDEQKLQYAKDNAKGLGSSKNLEISRIVERYQGVRNSFNRILHTLDVYKRPEVQGEYAKNVLAKGKDALLSATSSDHTMKLNTINNPEFYKDIMYNIWDRNNIQDGTKKGMEISDNLANGDVKGRFEKYIQRFQDVIANNDIDFTKPNHIINKGATGNYTGSEVTRMSKFNLVAQNSVDVVKNAAERKYGNQKWLRIASAIGGTVVGATILAQFGFGKIRNPHNIEKQVSDDANS
mgnify:CR=1 FL=1